MRPLVILLVTVGSYYLAAYLQRRRDRRKARATLQARLEALRALERMQRADYRERWVELPGGPGAGSGTAPGVEVGKAAS